MLNLRKIVVFYSRQQHVPAPGVPFAPILILRGATVFFFLLDFFLPPSSSSSSSSPTSSPSFSPSEVLPLSTPSNPRSKKVRWETILHNWKGASVVRNLNHCWSIDADRPTSRLTKRRTDKQTHAAKSADTLTNRLHRRKKACGCIRF